MIKGEPTMTRKEIAEKLYELKKDHLPNLIYANRPLTKKEFVNRYLNGCGRASGFSKSELQTLLELEMGRS